MNFLVMYVAAYNTSHLFVSFLNNKFHFKCTVMACQAVGNIVKTSLGPVGLDKVCIHR